MVPAVGSAPAVAGSTTSRGRCRAPRRPRGHRQNRSERSDTATAGRRTLAGRPRCTAGHLAASRSSYECRRRSGDHLGDQRSNALFELGECMFVHTSTRADQQQSGRDVGIAQNRPQPTPKSIALHGGPSGATDGEGHLRWNHLGIGNERAPQRIDPHADAVSPKADECVALADPVDQADRRARPLARRDFSTARPARVLMRARNPCLRARRRLLG